MHMINCDGLIVQNLCLASDEDDNKDGRESQCIALEFSLGNDFCLISNKNRLLFSQFYSKWNKIESFGAEYINKFGAGRGIKLKNSFKSVCIELDDQLSKKGQMSETILHNNAKVMQMIENSSLLSGIKSHLNEMSLTMEQRYSVFCICRKKIHKDLREEMDKDMINYCSKIQAMMHLENNIEIANKVFLGHPEIIDFCRKMLMKFGEEGSVNGSLMEMPNCAFGVCCLMEEGKFDIEEDTFKTNSEKQSYFSKKFKVFKDIFENRFPLIFYLPLDLNFKNKNTAAILIMILLSNIILLDEKTIKQVLKKISETEVYNFGVAYKIGINMALHLMVFEQEKAISMTTMGNSPSWKVDNQKKVSFELKHILNDQRSGKDEWECKPEDLVTYKGLTMSKERFEMLRDSVMSRDLEKPKMAMTYQKKFGKRILRANHIDEDMNWTMDELMDKPCGSVISSGFCKFEDKRSKMNKVVPMVSLLSDENCLHPNKRKFTCACCGSPMNVGNFIEHIPGKQHLKLLNAQLVRRDESIIFNETTYLGNSIKRLKDIINFIKQRKMRGFPSTSARHVKRFMFHKMRQWNIEHNIIKEPKTPPLHMIANLLLLLALNGHIISDLVDINPLFSF
jgi:hypothetical protein